jgi:uncharacterized protein (TIGR01319 family)
MDVLMGSSLKTIIMDKMADFEKVKIIIATDCGSTTTKARLFMKIGNEYRFVCTGEAPTTVEAPYEDVTMGVRNAIREVEEMSGISILGLDGIRIRSPMEERGVDLYVTTSSAGGGLQMTVFGGTLSITAESAERAALGGGAIVLDVQSTEDEIPIYKKIQRTRFLRPDMILLSGGTDGGSMKPGAKASEILSLAAPKARFGEAFILPVIYAGNKNARELVKNTLKDDFALKIVDNLRPKVNLENTDPARDAIQELFMEHVMSHAPGYDKLMKWTDIPIMPTPMGEGNMFQTVARIQRVNVIGVGLGGATTNVYSIFDGKFVRTVSANLGMSYSICNVLKETGIENILRWVPFEIEEDTLINILSNKMIRPTIIPQILDVLIIEHAVAREALRLGFIHHKFLARGLRGVIPTGTLDDILNRPIAGKQTYIDLLRVELIGGTGGLLSHAPRRIQSMMMMIDGFQPEGVTRLIQDSVFMFPHLGILSNVYPDIAYEIFEKDAVISLGTCIAPRGGENRGREEVMKVELSMPDGNVRIENLVSGEILRIPLGVEEVIDVKITPKKNYDVGAGPGHELETRVKGGEVGIILDARGRPFSLPKDRETMKKTLLKWFGDLEMYSEEALKRYRGEG